MAFLLSRRQVLAHVPAAACVVGAMPAQTKTLPGTWRTGPDLPLQVQEIYPAAFNGNLHLAGGMYRTSAGLPASDRHVVLAADKTRWHDAAPLPEARHHPFLIATNNALYAIGGFTRAGQGWAMQSQVWRYDADQDQWHDASALPAPRGETTGGVVDGRIHLVGGRIPKGAGNSAWSDHKDDNAHVVFDPGTGLWQTATPAPTARNSAAGIVINGLFYVVGGRQAGRGNIAMTEIYDPDEDKWRTGAPMPRAQGGLAAASVGGKLYAFGGEYFGAGGGGVFKQTWEYDPAKDKWRAMAPMPTPRHGLGAVAIGQKIYVIGGATQASGRGTSAKVEIFMP